MTHCPVSEIDLDDMLVLTVSVFRVVFPQEMGYRHDDDTVEYIVATSFEEAVEIARAVSEDLDAPIGLIETLGPIYVSEQAKIKIESNGRPT